MKMVWEETIIAAGTISDPNLCLHLSLLVQQVHFGHTEPTTLLQTQHEISHPHLLPFRFIFFTSLEISPLFIHLINTMSSNSSIISSEPLSPLYQSLFHSTVKIFVSFLFFPKGQTLVKTSEVRILALARRCYFSLAPNYKI